MVILMAFGKIPSEKLPQRTHSTIFLTFVYLFPTTSIYINFFALSFCLDIIFIKLV